MCDSEVTMLVQPVSLELRLMYEEFYSCQHIKGGICCKCTRDTGEQSGLDLLCPRDIVIKAHTYGNHIPLGIRAVLVKDKRTYPYHLDPRSSTGKNTPLRLANSQGKIDLCYRGEIGALVDNFSDQDYTITKGQRLFQLTQPNSMPFKWEIYMEDLAKDYPTERGENGFGSTGK